MRGVLQLTAQSGRESVSESVSLTVSILGKTTELDIDNFKSTP